MRILLDTCSFLWIASGSDHLSMKSRNLFSDRANEIFLSPVSAWEITLKHSLGRLPLPENPNKFLPKYREKHGIQSLPLCEEAALQLSRLPDLHKDPFDRMIICQAIADGLAIMTPDELITQYPVQVIW